jgi:hypothetical protein
MRLTRNRAARGAGLLLTLLLLAPSAAHALTFSIGFEGGTVDTFTMADAALLGCGAAGGGATLCSGGGTADDGSGITPSVGSGWLLEQWSLFLDPDPTVNNQLVIVNNTAATQTVVATVILPIAPAFGPPSLIRGSVGGSATDLNGNGVTLSTTGLNTSIYTALIDGSSVRTLLNHPFSASTPNPFGTAQLPAGTNFGIPVQESVAVATTTNIAIQLRFDLSAGDSAAITSVFNVEAVPEPSTALLVGGGLLGLVAVSRRLRPQR